MAAGTGLAPFYDERFPYGDFHQEIVKHDVYLPTWADKDRLDYTIKLIDILHELLPEGLEGSISTLPICWPDPKPTEEFIGFAAEQFRRTARHLARLEQERGRLIYVCIEPEPGCYLQRTEDVIKFYENALVLPNRSDEEIIRRHIRVCHDVCHSAVMFEPQKDVLARFESAGIHIGKVQVSSAIRLPLARLDQDSRREGLDQLSKFAEDRYLHQTVVMQSSGIARFYDDLPAAIDQIDTSDDNNQELRVHFHVPVYLEEFGMLQTSRDDIVACWEATRKMDKLTHFEVETYAWNVLPEPLQQAKLADGIAAELEWFGNLVSI